MYTYIKPIAGQFYQFNKSSSAIAQSLSRACCTLVVMLATLPSAAYSVEIFVHTTEFSTFGSRGASDESELSSTFAGAGVQLGDGRPTFGFSVVTPFTAPVAEAVSFGSEDGTFGGYVNTAGSRSDIGADTLGQRGNATGAWGQSYTRDVNTTEIPFRISNTKLMLVDAAIEDKPNPTIEASLSLAIVLGSEIVWVEHAKIGAPNGQFEITDPTDNLKGDFTVHQMNHAASGEPPLYKDWYAEYLFDIYEGSIDVSNIDPGEPFKLSFSWFIDANQGLGETGALASFYDPVGESGGISIDLSGLTPVDGGSPIPIPGAALLFLSGLISLGSVQRLSARYRID